MIKHIDNDLISLAKEGEFDVIGHGCNCFGRMQRGLALQMAEAFGCDKFPMEAKLLAGDVNKLGTVDYKGFRFRKKLTVVNMYTQYHWDEPGSNRKIPFEYDALYVCLVKLNYLFRGKHIGLPWIGCGLAGGDRRRVEDITRVVMRDCDVTIVNFVA